MGKSPTLSNIEASLSRTGPQWTIYAWTLRIKNRSKYIRN